MTAVTMRAFDPAHDFPAVVELIGDVNALGVDTENPTGALGLYQRFGFKAVRTWVFLRKPFEEVPADG
jgi:hypothetical protein